MPWWARRSGPSGRRDERARRGAGARRRRRWPWVILGVLVLSGLLLQSLIRDLPRRIVEARLSDALDAEVAVGVLRLAGYPRVVLENVAVRRAETLPWLRIATFPEIDAEVRLRALLDGRVDRLLIPGGRIELDARCDLALRLPETPAELELGELAVADLDIGLHFAGRQTTAAARVDLRRDEGAGGAWTGSWELAAEEADVDTVLVLLAGEEAPACRDGDGERELIARGLLAQGEILTVAAIGDRADSAVRAAPRTGFRGTVQAADLAVAVAGRDLIVTHPRGEVDWQTAAPRRLVAAFELGPLGRGRLAAELDGESGLFRSFEGEVRELDLGILLPLAVADVTSAEGGAELHLRLGEEGVGVWEGKAALSALALHGAGGTAELRSVELEISGQVEPGQVAAALTMKGRASSATLETAEGWTVQAAALRLRGEGEVIPTEVAPWIRVGVITAELGARLEPWGEVEVTATLDPEASVDALRGTWVWHGTELAALLDRLASDGARGWTGWRVEGRVDGAGSFSGGLREPTLRGRLQAHGLGVDGDDGGMSYRAVRASLELRLAAGRETAVQGSSSGEVMLGGLPAIPVDVEVAATSADGHVRLDSGAATLGIGGALGILTVTGSGREDSPWQGTLRLNEADVGAWYALLSPDPRSPLAPGGRLALGLNWKLDAERWSGEGTLGLEGGSLAAADGSRVLAPLDWEWAVSADADAQRLSAHLTGDLGGFQLLWDAVFADYGGTRVPLVIDVEGHRGDGGGSGWWLGGGAELDLGPGAVLRAHLAGASGGQIEYRLEARAADLGPVLEQLVREPFAAGDEPLGRLTGRGVADVAVAGMWSGSGGEARGVLRAADVDLALGDDIAVAGLDLELPLDLSWSISAGGAGGENLLLTGPLRSGTLRFDAFEGAGVLIPATAARLEVEGETVRLVDRLSVPVLGGSVLLAGLRLSAGLSGDGDGPRLESEVELDGLDLARITETFDLFPLEGRVDGVFPDVVVAGGALHTRGSGELSVFGGRAAVEQVGVSELFSRFPRVTFGARFENLDLGQITRTLEFGEITGRVRGELLAVELVGGAPVRFLGRVESVPVPEVKRRVSLKAANNLVLLGTGTTGALGGGLLPRLFDRFPYVGLGIELALARDRFQLRGLLRRGDRELFLKGRLPLRLDVVNVRPGATVSFKTMMSRLGNLEIGRPDQGGGSHEQRGRD